MFSGCKHRLSEKTVGAASPTLTQPLLTYVSNKLWALKRESWKIFLKRIKTQTFWRFFFAPAVWDEKSLRRYKQRLSESPISKVNETNWYGFNSFSFALFSNG